MEPITLDGLVEAAASRFPALSYKDGGNRAEAAADLVPGVHYMGMEGGSDWWEVGDHICSIKARHCSCRDYAAPIHDGGRLCKHRMAAMFVTKLEWAARERIVALCEAAPDGRLTLKVEAIYLDGGGRAYRLMGHHFPGHAWETYPQAECYPFNPTLFENAMVKAKWGIAERPIRQKNFCYHYLIERGAPAGFSLGMAAGEDVDRKARERRFDEIRAIIEVGKEIA